MSFASKYRGKELTVMVKFISIFGIVEMRQMKDLFSHLNSEAYGSIINRLHLEGMVYTTDDAKYLASTRLSAKKADIKASVDCFWALIGIKDRIEDFCAGEAPALLTISAGGMDYDLIPVSDRTIELVNDTCFDLPDDVRRLLVVKSGQEENIQIERRLHNDFIVLVDDDGVVGTYEL